jgi:hypothetical protein
MSFYNTIHEQGEQLNKSEAKAVSQEVYILYHFKANKGRSYTPFEVQQAIPELHNTPITSIRRAITNLTNQGQLEHTHDMRQGDYGKLNHTWRYRDRKEGQLRLF